MAMAIEPVSAVSLQRISPIQLQNNQQVTGTARDDQRTQNAQSTQNAQNAQNIQGAGAQSGAQVSTEAQKGFGPAAVYESSGEVNAQTASATPEDSGTQAILAATARDEARLGAANGSGAQATDQAGAAQIGQAQTGAKNPATGDVGAASSQTGTANFVAATAQANASRQGEAQTAAAQVAANASNASGTAAAGSATQNTSAATGVNGATGANGTAQANGAAQDENGAAANTSENSNASSASNSTAASSGTKSMADIRLDNLLDDLTDEKRLLQGKVSMGPDAPNADKYRSELKDVKEELAQKDTDSYRRLYNQIYAS